MRLRFLFCCLWMISGGTPPASAQDTTLALNTALFNPNQIINIASLKGWVYQAGNNLAWAGQAINTANWQQLRPADISIKQADKAGRVEGWFRVKFRLDATFRGVALGIQKNSWAAIDLYLDGRWLASYGNTGSNSKPYQEHYPYFKPYLPIQLTPERDHLLAVHFVDHVSPFSPKKLKSELEDANQMLLWLGGPRAQDYWLNFARSYPIYATLWLTVSVIMTLLFWLLSFQNLAEKKVIQLLAIWGSLSTLNNLGNLAEVFEPGFVVEVLIYRLSLTLTDLLVPLLIIALRSILGFKSSHWFNGLLIVISVVGAALGIYLGTRRPGSIANSVQFLIFLYLLISYWKKLQGAQWAIVVGVILTILFYLATALIIFGVFTGNFYTISSGYFLSLPFCLIIYIVLRFREILAEVRVQAAAVVSVTEEKSHLLATQNQLLEQQVEVRTAALNRSLTELQATQAQLVQKEKLASLGELTAGIAHEIQNPLNFVNNFSEVSSELVKEMKEERAKGEQRDEGLETELLDDLEQNLHKIHHHGGRASRIVKGMLAHSRTESGEKRPTELNALANEYLQLAYHGFKAKDKDFVCQLTPHFDPLVGQVEVVSQEIGRVLLNLYNNAFYAVQHRGLLADTDYQPSVYVSTKRLTNSVEIRVQDNGTGIPDSVKAKIFQPFFTTKPAGEGTGLGLSLSYDIITKGHGGTLSVESQVGEGSTFVIIIPQR